MVFASRQAQSESQQNDREHQKRDGAQAIIALPQVNDEHHDHADDWQQDEERDPNRGDAHITPNRQLRRVKP